MQTPDGYDIIEPTSVIKESLMNENITVLLIDDETALCKAISTVLRTEQIATVCAGTAEEGLSLAKSRRFDLILLDIMLPDRDGFDTLSELRANGNLTPVIILSGKDDDDDQVHGLVLGADDYVTKPFSKAVLVSKIKAVIRRSQQYTTSTHPEISLPLVSTTKKGPFVLHFDTHSVEKNGEDISLTPKEFALLCLFLENPDKILTRQEIYSRVWKSETPNDSTILVYIKKLRTKIEDNPSKPQHLLTVWEKGYRFVL